MSIKKTSQTWVCWTPSELLVLPGSYLQGNQPAWLITTALRGPSPSRLRQQPGSNGTIGPLLQPQTREVGKWEAVRSPFSLSLWTKRNHQNFVKASDHQWTKKPRSGKHTTHARCLLILPIWQRAWGHRSRRPLQLEHLSSFGGFHFCSYPRTIQILTNCCHLLVNSILIMNLQKWVIYWVPTNDNGECLLNTKHSTSIIFFHLGQPCAFD